MTDDKTKALPELIEGGSHYTQWIKANMPLTRPIHFNDVVYAIDTCEAKRIARELAISQQLNDIIKEVSLHIDPRESLNKLKEELEKVK